MKKFSSQIKQDINVKVIATKIDETISELVGETVYLKITNEDLTTSDLVPEGKDELVDALVQLVEDEKSYKVKKVTESLKSKFGNYIDQNYINQTIKKLNEEYVDLNIIPNPKDIFSSEDYTSSDVAIEEIVLDSLDEMPSVYLDYINLQSSNYYFSEGHYIIIRYVSPTDGWELSFGGNMEEYGTSITSPSEKRNMFIESHGDFIKSFYEATVALIGESAIMLDDAKILAII